MTGMQLHMFPVFNSTMLYTFRKINKNLKLLTYLRVLAGMIFHETSVEFAPSNR